MKQGGLRRPLSTGEETRKGRDHSLRKHVFSVYRGACPVPMLCSLIWSQKKKKKIKCAASSLRYIWRLENLDCCRRAVLGFELARAGASCPICCQCPATRGLRIPTQEATWKTKCPSVSPRNPVGGDGRSRQPWCSWGFGCFNTESVCVCEYPGVPSLTLPELAPLAWLTWSNKPTILEPPDFSHPLLSCWTERALPNT